MEWVALTHAHERKQEGAENPVILEAPDRIRGARRLEPTNRTYPPGQRTLVDPQQGDEKVPRDHSVEPFGAAVWVVRGIFASALRNESPRAAKSRPAPLHSSMSRASVRGRAGEILGMTTTSMPAGKSSGLCRNASRMRRLARLRRTESPNLRVTVIPSRAARSSPRAARSTMQLGSEMRDPLCWTGRNSLRLRSRLVFGNESAVRPLNVRRNELKYGASTYFW